MAPGASRLASRPESHLRCIMNSGISDVSRSVLPVERHEFPLSTTIGDIDVVLKCSALRYPVSQHGVTLIFTHGITGHKEQYHTTISRLLGHRDTATYDIREVWSIDFPNHGEAATLNRHTLDEHKANALRAGSDGICTTMDWAAYLSAFLSLPRFRGHTLVGMAHSGSCTVWVHALTKFARTYPHALIFLEPTLMFPDMSPTDPRAIHGAANVRAARSKRDVWASRKELRQWLTQRGKSLWARWDPRVFDLFVEHAFEERTQDDRGACIVTPKLRTDEEASLYACIEHTVTPSQLATVCAALGGVGKRGIHFIWAEIEEFVSKRAKGDMLEAAQHRVSTQRTIKGSGHLVPQLKPDALGDTLHEVLGLVGSGATRSLL